MVGRDVWAQLLCNIGTFVLTLPHTAKEILARRWKQAERGRKTLSPVHGIDIGEGGRYICSIRNWAQWLPQPWNTALDPCLYSCSRSHPDDSLAATFAFLPLFIGTCIQA